MNYQLSPISFMHAVPYAMMVIPTLALRWKKNDNSKGTRNINRIRIVLYLAVLLALFVPIGLKKFGYASVNLFIIWLISIPVTLVIYWIAFILVYKNKLHVCSLDILYAIFLCISGLTMGEIVLYRYYWTLVILGGCLFVLSIVQIVNDRNRH